MKQITVLIVLFFLSPLLAVVVGSDLGSAADSGNESITADFSASPLTGEAPLTVQFTDRSTGSPETWEWDFGDGGTSSAKNPSYTYSRAGTYTVSLEAGNGVSSDSEVTKNFITVKEKPVVPVVEASFSANTTSGKAPLTVRFTDSSGGGPTAWKWDFGDSTTSATQNPVHTYSAAGKYSVTLRATNGTVSDDVTRSDYITVDGNGPLASFTASPLEGLAPLTVQFTDTSTGSPTKWEWDFGDGGKSTSKNPSHTYSGAGTYTVKLTVTNSYGSDTADSSVNAYSITAPVADFSANPVSGSVPLSVQFTDMSSNGPTAWEWDFDSDGVVDSTEQNPVYVYTSEGAYSVTLNAVNGTATGTETKSSFITAGNMPAAAFTSSPQEGNAPLTVQFNDTSSGNVDSWFWEFGDGNTSTARSPSHIYSSSGNYNVKLTVTNSFGSNSTEVPSSVKVLSDTAPSPDFTSNVTSGKAPLAVQFEDLSTGGPTAWEWDFNSDGTIDSTEQSPVHGFADTGFYTVTLRAGNGTAWDSITKSEYIMVGDGLHASFTVSAREGGIPLAVQFTDTSMGNITAWHWDFGDGSTSTSQSPSHEYTETGSYSVTLNVSNAYGYSSVTWADYIKAGEEERVSSGSGGSGGSSAGGGGGGSPEPASNVEVKELAQEFITTGDRIKFEFTRNATAIVYVKFDSKRTLGKTTTMIEQLKGRSVLTPKEPPGKVYKYLNIWVGNEGIAAPENIANAIIGFRVRNTEISENETEGPSVFMYRYSEGKWNALPTRKMGEDGQYMYFESRTPGFSPFAIITGKKAIEYKENETETAEPLPELSIKSRQAEMPDSWSVPAAEYKDWSGVSTAIKVVVGFLVILLIGIAITEKKKR